MNTKTSECIDNLYNLLSDYPKKDDGIDITQVDSFEFIQLMLGIEEAYDIVFDEEMMTYETLQNISYLASYIVGKTQ